MPFSKLVRWGGLLTIVLLAGCVVLGYIFGFFEWRGWGLNDKSLWDWLELLIVPAALAIGVFLLNRAQSARTQAIEDQRAEDAALQTYLSDMQTLLIDKNLGAEHRDDATRTVARVRTLTVLNSLSSNGKRNVLQFLDEADLIGKERTVVDLTRANLTGSNLNNLVLEEVNLRSTLLSGATGAAKLRGADLRGAWLSNDEVLRATSPDNIPPISEAYLSSVGTSDAARSGAKLRNADLREADLSEAILFNTDLSGADLKGATLFGTDLRGAALRNADLRGATLVGTDLRGSDLSGADMRGIRLSGASLHRANLSHADLSDTDLGDAFLYRSNLNGANLSGADLRDANLYGSDLLGAVLFEPIWDGAGADTWSSRTSHAGAGWRCAEDGASSGRRKPYLWVYLKSLWTFRYQILAYYLEDPTKDERRQWINLQRKAGKLQKDLTIEQHADLKTVSFVVLGETGVGTASQYAMIRPLLARGRETDFMVVCGGVVLPAGDVEQYEEKFYRPYADYPSPIYALPSNHEWYDNLHGFMYHMCGAEDSLPTEPDSRISSPKEQLRRRLLRKASRRNRGRLPERKRTEGNQRSSQGSPYFAIETGPLLIVGIDTGIGGGIDSEQGEWLRRVSQKVDKPKILLTGKPLYVDGEYHPHPIEGGGTVDEIVRAREHGYVVVIGGGPHNYQRYSVRVSARDAPLHYIASGGGGAYTRATHWIPKVDLPGVGEEDFVCYPRRSDSLSLYSRLYDSRFGTGSGRFEITPDEAAQYMGKRLGLRPQRPADIVLWENRLIDIDVSERADVVPDMIYSSIGPLGDISSQGYAWGKPPLFQHFLHIEAFEDELRIRCFAVTGCPEHWENPPLEDEIVIALDA